MFDLYEFLISQSYSRERLTFSFLTWQTTCCSELEEYHSYTLLREASRYLEFCTLIVFSQLNMNSFFLYSS